MIEQPHLDFLYALETELVGHSKRNLLTHLVGTHDLLECWGAAQDVCLAGLFHSIYGTNSFKHQCLDASDPRDRAMVRLLIGKRAEFLAFMFCVEPKRSKWLELGHHEASQELKDLLEIESANLLEQGSRGKALEKLSRHPGISGKARAALQQALHKAQESQQESQQKASTGTKADQHT